MLQVEDLRQLGRLALSLAAHTPNPTNFAPSEMPSDSNLPSGITPAAIRTLDGLHRTYSERFKSAVLSLLDAGSASNPSAVHDVASFAIGITDHMFNALDASLNSSNELNSELMRELQNGRLIRLLAKLGFINERPEYSPHDPTSATISASAPMSLQRAAWSETGERFYLKLFRDYVFHQVSAEDGRPVIDLGHVIGCLNKLDAGSEEQIAMISRDEQHIIIMSYRELKHGLESTFQELRSAAHGTSNAGMGSGSNIRR